MSVPTASEGKALLREWSKRLGLTDWHLQLHVNCAPTEMGLQDCAGECEFQWAIKAAIIRTIHPGYYPVGGLPFDFERTLVHELLHLKFCLLDECQDESVQSRLTHQLIEDLARALVAAKRCAPN